MPIEYKICMPSSTVIDLTRNLIKFDKRYFFHRYESFERSWQSMIDEILLEQKLFICVIKVSPEIGRPTIEKSKSVTQCATSAREEEGSAATKFLEEESRGDA